MKRFRFTFLLLSIFLSAISCNRNIDSKIKKHFDKFILIDNYKDFEISSIKRISKDTITNTNKQQAIIFSNIIKLKESNRITKYEIGKKQHEINVVKNGREKKLYESNVFDWGHKKQMGNYVAIYSDNIVFDTNIEGRKNLLLRLNKELENLKKDISTNNKIIKDDFEKIKTLDKKKEKTILEIRSTVYLKGYTASGQKIITYRVRQDSEGNILLLTKL
ncbi:hypothetical protein [Chryseobacterium sp. 5_R23647]|uniref:hypothetical protein n=1 Tax=Chryseobacterium sp. 5_R23647 TaxID=2258964 RepID=UPI000E26B91A|nr:hypothetical protein [Chryseobacterium sp. 5_R23647]REC43029.1 hypothetical protein DRF69_09905 [Chryseobacterium sp. 5_R23647]